MNILPITPLADASDNQMVSMLDMQVADLDAFNISIKKKNDDLLAKVDDDVAEDNADDVTFMKLMESDLDTGINKAILELASDADVIDVGA